MPTKKQTRARKPLKKRTVSRRCAEATGSEFPYETAARRKWFTIPEITAFIRGEVLVDLGGGCPISRREKERNKTLEYIASRLEACTNPSDGDIPF